MISDDESDMFKSLVPPSLKGEDQSSEKTDIANELSNVCCANDQSEGQKTNLKYKIDLLADKNETYSSSSSSPSLQSEILLN